MHATVTTTDATPHRKVASPDEIEALLDNAAGRRLTDEEALIIGSTVSGVLANAGYSVRLGIADDTLTREFARGERCAVCLRYDNDDCTTEC